MSGDGEVGGGRVVRVVSCLPLLCRVVLREVMAVPVTTVPLWPGPETPLFPSHLVSSEQGVWDAPVRFETIWTLGDPLPMSLFGVDVIIRVYSLTPVSTDGPPL